MDSLYKNKFCRDFLNQYTEANYPELLSQLVKLAILYLQKLFRKPFISPAEISEALYYMSMELQSENQKQNQTIYQNMNQSKKFMENSGLECPPVEKPINYPLQKLNKNGPPEYLNGGKLNDEIYVNVGNNFYDLNYYIPKCRSLRNKNCLYKRLMVNPIFNTQCKKIYPHWWWNLKDEKYYYESDDSEEDHHPRSPKKIHPKELETEIKNRRNKSLNNIKVEDLFDENRIFGNYNNYPNNNYPRNFDDSYIPNYSNGFYNTTQNFRKPYNSSATIFSENQQKSSLSPMMDDNYIPKNKKNYYGYYPNQNYPNSNYEDSNYQNFKYPNQNYPNSNFIDPNDPNSIYDGRNETEIFNQNKKTEYNENKERENMGVSSSSGGSNLHSSSNNILAKGNTSIKKVRPYKLSYTSNFELVDVSGSKKRIGKPKYSVQGDRLIREEGKLKRKKTNRSNGKQ